MDPLPIEEGRRLHGNYPALFPDVDFNAADHLVNAALQSSVVKKFSNNHVFVNCLHFAFGDPGAMINNLPNLLFWARAQDFVHLPPGTDGATVDVWGQSETVLHATRLIDPVTDLWASVMGVDAELGLTHPRMAFAGSDYGDIIVSFVHFKNWNEQWMKFKTGLKT